MFKRTARRIDTADSKQVDAIVQQFRPTIPLDRAMLCLDCESLFEAEGTQRCPSCGSNISWSVGRVLNRLKETKTCS